MPCMAAMQKKSKKAQVSNLKLQVKKSHMGTTKSTPRFLQKLFELVNEHKMTTIKPHSSHIFEMVTLKKELMETFPISNYTSQTLLRESINWVISPSWQILDFHVFLTSSEFLQSGKYLSEKRKLNSFSVKYKDQVVVTNKLGTKNSIT